MDQEKVFLPKVSGIKEEVFQQLICLAKEYQIERMILFGSRARGDFYTVSDIDLAVSGGDFNRFALDAEECIDTLLKFDIINLNAPMEEELLESMNKDGIIIYEKI